MRKSKKAEYKYKIFGIAVIAIMAVIFSMYGDRISTNVDNNIKQDNIINDNELKQDMSDLKIYFFDQTTLNMIQDISSIIARKPMIIGEI